MSFKAELDIGGKIFELRECRCSLRQVRDIQGKPDSGVRGGIIKMLFEGTEDDTFSSWICDPLKKESGSITLYRIDQESKFKQIEFEGAYLVNLIESFVTDNDISRLEWEEMAVADNDLRDTFEFIMENHLRTRSGYLVFCRISAEKIKIDGIKHDNRWQ